MSKNNNDSKHLDKGKTIVLWEHLLIKRIMNPAMITSWTFGILLLLTPGIVDWAAFWIWIKIASVILMTGFHGFLLKQQKLLKNNHKVILVYPMPEVGIDVTKVIYNNIVNNIKQHI